MNDAAASDPLLARFKQELAALYGARLKRVLLYGSRARGDHTAESDYDILVVLTDGFDRWEELGRLAKLSSDLTFETGEVASFKPVTEADIAVRTGFMHNVRKEARAI